jgi:Glu-tRNA(Gln) amidotransferase subunit E-like FAD-binding protein
MQEINYQKLKFKSGLEIHQQLDTNKLFCNCLSVLRKDKPDFEIERRLHLVAGEGGKVDVATKHESSKNKKFVYQGYDTICLVELDEEPPHKINQEALKIAIQIGLLMNMKIIPITQIMRKTVVDGSNTSGFQRTVLIARDGSIETKNGKVGIDYLYLEEDAARIVEKFDNKSVYKLDRLGIPLVEIVTAPDIKTPEQAKEVALKIGDILRNCKVRRGLGTIRQDVNISIRKEKRVEIKGMQNMDIFIDAIKNEIFRQKKLSDEKKPTEMEVRNVLSDASTEFLRPLPGSARMYPETDLELLKISRNFINESKKTLPKLKKDIEKGLKEDGLNEEMIKLLFKQNKLDEFKELSLIFKKPNLVGKILLIYPKEIASHKKISLKKVQEILNIDVLVFVLESLRDKKIIENQIKEVLERIVQGKSLSKSIKFEKINFGNLEEKIMKIIKDKPYLSDKAYMGLIMKEFRGKIDGKTAIEIIRKFVKKPKT